MKEIIRNINKTPVNTFSWLNVNEAQLKSFVSPEIKPYNNEFLKEVIGEDYVVKSIKKALKPVNVIFNSIESNGISPELTYEIEKKYNGGALVHIKKGSRLKNPIIIEFALDEKNPTLVDNNLIIAEENSEAVVIIKYYSKGEFKGYHNGFTKVYAKDNSKLKVIKVQLLNDETTHFDANVAKTEYNAELEFINAELGAASSITNYKTDLVGENSKLNLDSIYLGDKKKVIDINYKTDHIGRRTTSNMITKGVLLDESSKTYRGTIDFKKGAVKSKGNEEEYSLTLSPKVVSKSMPLMLCDEDDVEGNHAASTGKVGENLLFYIMSRGFSEGEAKKIVIEASFNPILDKIKHPIIINELKEEIKRRLEVE